MAPEQKMAWLIVVSYTGAFICVVVLKPFFGVVVTGVAICLLVALSLASMIFLQFRRKRDPNEVLEDERDKMIAKQATIAGAMLSYGTFVLACLILAGIYESRGEEMIPVGVLHNIVGAGVIVFFLARSITILAMYGRAGKDSKD